jgi:hypothetical protein
MFRSTLFAVLCLAAAPAFAQNEAAPAPSGPPPEAMAAIQQAGMAFGQCVQTAVGSVPATVTPEAGATSVLATCASQRQALDRAATALVAAMPEAQRPMVQEQINGQLAGIPGQIAGTIQAARGSPAAPAATPAH